MAENSCFDAEDHEEQLQRDHRFQQDYQEEAKSQGILAASTTTTSNRRLHCQQQFYRKPEQQQNEDSGIRSPPSERCGETAYTNNVHSTNKFLLDPAISKFSPRSSTSSNSSSSNLNNNNNNNGRSASFQFHQVPTHHSQRGAGGGAPDKNNYKNRTRGIERLYITNSANCGREGKGGGSCTSGGGSNRHTRITLLGRFRSQTNIANLPFPVKIAADGSSKSVMTSPVDHPPPSPISLKSSSSNLASSNGSHHGSKPHKPKKWFSFTNLLSRQNLTGILNIPKSRLSVSSTLNSVFVGPTSPSPSDSCPGSGRGSGSFFNGYNNLNGEGESASPGQTFSAGYAAPASPTPSCATVSGEFPTRSLSAGANSNSGQVVFRRKNNGGSSSGGGGGRSGSSSGTSSTATNFNVGTAPTSGNFSGVKHHSSGSGCGNNSESASERSSGIGYSSYNSTAGSTASIGFHYGANGANRLSCGEFFTGTPNSPIFSTETPADFPFNFSFGSDLPSGQYENATGIDNSCNSGGVTSPYYNTKKALGRSLPALLGNLSVFFVQ